MPLSILNDRAELRNVNMGFEGSGEGTVTRLDLKFVFNADSSILKSLMNVKKDDKKVFWSGNNVLDGLESVRLASAWHHNNFSFGALEEDLLEPDTDLRIDGENTTVKGVVLKPMPNHLLEVSLTVQMRTPDEHQLKLVAAFGKKSANLKLEFDPALEGSPDPTSDGAED